MTTYYFGKIILTDACDAGVAAKFVSDNNKCFRTKDQLTQDVVDNYLRPFLDEWHPEALPRDDQKNETWESYFGAFPIKDADDMDAFMSKLKDSMYDNYESLLKYDVFEMKTPETTEVTSEATTKKRKMSV